MKRKVAKRTAMGVLAACLCAGPACAGNFTFVNGQVAWQSTDCPPPPIPAAGSVEAEQPADDLNAQRLVYNGYARQTQTYMNCLSAEAERDTEAMNDITTKSAQTLIDAAQLKLERLAVAPRRDE